MVVFALTTMRAMASRLLSSLKSHPLIIASFVLLLFALPIFRMLVFFWPLIVSTVLGVLAVVSFGRTADAHDLTSPAPESALQADADVTFSSHEGKIGNVLMVGNREVTWLEWLHNEDTQKLCIHEHEPAVWDVNVDACDSSLVVSELMKIVAPSSGAFTDASTGKLDGLDDAPPLLAVDKGILFACGSPEDEQMANVSTEEYESTEAGLPSTVMDALNDLNRETATMKASTKKDKTNPGEGRHEVLHSVNEATACAHEQEALVMTPTNENVSPFPEMKDANVCKMQGSTEEKSEEEKGKGPQWDVSDGEEDGSGLHFSFFHNRSHTPSKP